jgi:tellurite resistance protein TehA-like permease
MAAAVWFTAGRRVALPVGAAAIVLAVVLIALYRSSGNLLAARPGVTAVLAAVGVFLVASASARSPEPSDRR